MTKLSEPTKQYLEQMVSFSQNRHQGQGLEKIHVDYVASKLAALYEKMRQVIDYQEEHLLRKNAILRVLNRRMLLSKEPKELAQPLIQELIRAGYFPNDVIPEKKIADAQNALEKYIFLLQNIPSQQNLNEKADISTWIKGLAGCEIEQILSPGREEKILLDYMVKTLSQRIKIENSIPEEEKGLQIKIACQKALLKSDDVLISFGLFLYYVPKWSKLDWPELKELSQKIPYLKKEIDWQISRPENKRISQIALIYTAPFLIINDLVSKNPSEAVSIFEEPETLEKKLLSNYNKRLGECRKKIQRSGLRSLLSLFLSRAALAFLIEIPFDIYITQSFSWLALTINILFPTLLMFLIVFYLIKTPKLGNGPKIVMKAMELIKQSETTKVFEIKTKKSRNKLLDIGLSFLFLALSGTIFWALMYLLLRINFSILNIAIFFIFFCLVVFTGLKISVFAKELKIEEEKKEGVKTFLSDLFILPFFKLGKNISGQLKKYNFLILLLNLFFEAPLQTFIEFLEVWRSYLREKRQETE